MESRFQNTELTNNLENVHKCSYNKRSKVLNTFLFLFSSKIVNEYDQEIPQSQMHFTGTKSSP